MRRGKLRRADHLAAQIHWPCRSLKEKKERESFETESFLGCFMGHGRWNKVQPNTGSARMNLIHESAVHGVFSAAVDCKSSKQVTAQKLDAPFSEASANYLFFRV
jgi:hypothetical protein